MFLRFNAFEGPADWVFQDPDTGFQFQARTRQELTRLIITYRHNNNLPYIEHIDTVLDTYLCQQPLNQHKCQPAPLKRGFLGYLKGGIALVKSMLYNSYVQQGEADRRASICIKCPHNVFPDKGPFLKWSDDIAKEAVGDRRSVHHDELGNCEICTCPLRAKVWTGDPIDLPTDQLAQMRSVRTMDGKACWQPDFAKGNIDG